MQLQDYGRRLIDTTQTDDGDKTRTRKEKTAVSWNRNIACTVASITMEAS